MPRGRAGGRNPAELGIIGAAPCSTARYSTIAGEVGSTVSRNFTSDRSSMRAPFSEMLPVTRGVSILTRGRGGDRGVAADDGRGRAPAGWWRVAGGRASSPAAGVVVPGRRLRRRLGQFGLRLGLRALLFHLRHVVEILPGDQHEAGQNDGEDGVAIVGHRFKVSSFNSGSGFVLLPVEATQRRAKIVEHGREVAGAARRCRPTST